MGRQYYLGDALGSVRQLTDPVGSVTLVRSYEPTLGKTIHRPSYLSTPAFLLRLALGEFASALTEGHRVVPAVLLQAGFKFQYPALADALRSILIDG